MNDYNYFNYVNNMGFGQASIDSKAANIQNVDDPYLGFIRGNLFKNLYDPYKNYKPADITPDNEKDYARAMVQMYAFATHDLTLYLDTHPNDTAMINLRTEYKKLYEDALRNYENKYGALNLESNTLSKSPWGWETKYWPWEDRY